MRCTRFSLQIRVSQPQNQPCSQATRFGFHVTNQNDAKKIREKQSKMMRMHNAWLHELIQRFLQILLDINEIHFFTLLKNVKAYGYHRPRRSDSQLL